MNEDVDWYNLIAAKRGMPPGWRWCEVRCIGDAPSGGILVSGGIPRVLKSGPKKGQSTFRGVQLNEMLVTLDQIRDAKVAWEIEHKKCGECFGSGQVLRSWSQAEGRQTKPCKRCAGTGSFKAENDVAIGVEP